MQCNRLERQIKSWYLQVRDEAMAPARMVEFMEKHIAECEICFGDENVRRDVRRITDIVLPPAKIRKKAVAKTDDEQPAAESQSDSEVPEDNSEDNSENNSEDVEQETEDQIADDDDFGDEDEVELPLPEVE